MATTCTVPSPSFSGPCPAAARGFPWLLEASSHLLFAANTKGSSSKPVNPDQQRRCPEQVAEAATSEDRRTDNRTDRQHHQTPSTTPSLRRGAACSTGDVVAPQWGHAADERGFCASLRAAGLKYVGFCFCMRTSRGFRDLLLWIEAGQLWPSKSMAFSGSTMERAVMSGFLHFRGDTAPTALPRLPSGWR